MTDSIVIERVIAASPDRIYAHLTEPDLWVRWQGLEATVDAVPGGIFRLNMPNGMTARGQFVSLDPNQKVVFSWGWIDHPGLPPGSSTVEVELIPKGDETLVRLTHSGLPPDEIALHRLGWDHYVPRLAIVSEGGDPGVDPGPG